MKARYLILIAFVCFITIILQLTSVIHLAYPWTTGIILFIIGEFTFAMGLGKVMKRNREYHEEFIWREEENKDF